MQIYLAPLQGLTDWIFRESFNEHIGQFDKTFAPFIRTQNSEFYRPSQCNDILPLHNIHQRPVPQFLGNDKSSFLRFEDLCHEHQYSEVNINLGCPFSRVMDKSMGAGLLSQPEKLANLLDEIFSVTKLNISIKCRLGKNNVSEFEDIIPILNQYPLVEVIIHPRVGTQMYKGDVDYEAFAKYAPLINHPICYNGDISNIFEIQKIKALSPIIQRFMIGRGILKQPFLLSEIRNEVLTSSQKMNMLRNFHLSIIEKCKQKYSGDLHLLNRFVEMWEYHNEAYEDGRKIYKNIKKCNSFAKYEGIVFKAINEFSEH
jgi:tRNA-dihydrouridine synthase